VHNLVRKALDTADSQVGVREVGGPNRGPQVNEYLKSVGWGPGAPWCAAFVYWCIRGAARDAGARDVPFVRTAGCGVIEAWAKERDIYERGRPEPGDVFLRGTTHTGFVTAVRGNVFDTIEGNTNIGGSPEGIGVFRRTRPITRDYQFVRWGRLLGGAPDATYTLIVGGKPLLDMPVHQGRALCPVRRWGEAMGFAVGWDSDAQAVTFDRKRLSTQVVLIGDTGHAPIRDLAEAAGLTLTVDASARRIIVSRPRSAAAKAAKVAGARSPRLRPSPTPRGKRTSKTTRNQKNRNQR
jgi:hypothetical protein